MRSALAGRALLVVAALIALTFFVYAPVGHFDFVELDDPLYVRENPQVAGGLTWSGVSWAFSTGQGGYWIPLVWLSYMLDVQLHGMNAGALHVTNALLHAVNAILLFALFHRMTGALGRSAIIAALFAVHPLHVESVAWVTERKDVLSTLFWMLSMWAYVAYVRHPRWNRYLGVCLLFAMGLMAKPMVVTLPIVLLLLDVWPLRRVASGLDEARRPRSPDSRPAWNVWARLAWEKVPLIALAAASGIITFSAQQRVGAMAALDAIPITVRVQNTLLSYVSYIGKMVWPAHLSPLYLSFPALPAWGFAGLAVLLVGVTAGALHAGRRFPYVPMGWFWYLGALVPVTGLVQVGVQTLADRFTYVPLIGLFIIVAWGGHQLASRWRPVRVGAACAALLAVGACALAARHQVWYWKDSVTMWTRATEISLGTDSYRAHIALGSVVLEQGRSDEAVGHFSEAVRLKPESADAHARLGLAFSRQGKNEEAVAQYTEALRLDPGLPEAHHNVGVLLANQGRLAESLSHLSEAVRLRPDSDLARVSLGLALARLGRTQEASREFGEALRINPTNEVARRAMDELARAR